MDHELALTKANRLKLADAFRSCMHVDFSIDCVIEGQMGKAFGDRMERPVAFCITVGPFWYFAGDANSTGGLTLMKNFLPYNLLMPSTPGWLELAQDVFGQNLKPFPRYRFSSLKLDVVHLESLVQNSPHRDVVLPISLELATDLANQPEGFLELSDFDSPADFLERSIGFVAMDRSAIMGVAYASLVCSQGIEVSIFVEEAYRKIGVATALASRLLLEGLRRGLRPNWDAANLESCNLAAKLGYEMVGSYDAYYHTGK